MLRGFRVAGNTAIQVLKLIGQADMTGLTGGTIGALDQVEQKSGKAGGAISKLGTIATAAAAGGVLALAGGFAASVSKAADFEQSLANVSSVTGATKDELAALRQEALNVGRDTSKSASESVTAFGELLKSGMSVQDVIGGAGPNLTSCACGFLLRKSASALAASALLDACATVKIANCESGLRCKTHCASCSARGLSLLAIAPCASARCASGCS